MSGFLFGWTINLTDILEVCCLGLYASVILNIDSSLLNDICIQKWQLVTNQVNHLWNKFNYKAALQKSVVSLTNWVQFWLCSHPIVCSQTEIFRNIFTVSKKKIISKYCLIKWFLEQESSPPLCSFLYCWSETTDWFCRWIWLQCCCSIQGTLERTALSNFINHLFKTCQGLFLKILHGFLRI